MNKKKLIIIISAGLLLLIALIGIAGSNKDVQKSAQQGSRDAQKAVFSGQDVNENTVRSALNNLEDVEYRVISEKYISKVDVQENKLPSEETGDILVNVVFSPDNNLFLNGKDLLYSSAATSLAVMNRLFANPKINTVSVAFEGDFTDADGKTSRETAVSMSMNRSTADKINWQGLKEDTLADYNKFFEAVDSKNIRASLLKD